MEEENGLLLEENYSNDSYQYCILSIYLLMSLAVGLGQFGYSGIAPQMNQINLELS